MPNTTPLGGYRTPLSSEGNNAETFMSAFGLDIDPHTVLWATSTSDRDTRYGGAALPAGGVVACAALKTLWIKIATTGGTQWATVYSDTGWVTSGFAFPTSGFVSGTVNKIRNLSGQIELRLLMTMSGSDLTVGANGNISDIQIATIPSGYAPADSVPAQVLFGGQNCQGAVIAASGSPAGGVFIQTAAPNYTYPSGSAIRVNATWMLG